MNMDKHRCSSSSSSYAQLSPLSAAIGVCPCPFRLLFEEVSGTEFRNCPVVSCQT